MNKTKIEWCDSSWNPVTGCLHDCEYCYARKIAHRFGASNTDDTAIIDPRSGCKLHELDEPVTDILINKRIPYPYDFDPTLHKYRLNEPQKWSDPHTIFVGSMADLFGEWVPYEWIEAVFAACEKAPQHRYLFLTKNPQRYVELDILGKLPLQKNMWYGASTGDENLAFNACQIYGKLAWQTRGKANLFLSVEPILTDISRTGLWNELIFDRNADWIIVGAETGTRKNKVVPPKTWIDDIVKDCDYKKIPVFMKDSLIPIVGEENMRRKFPWEE